MRRFARSILILACSFLPAAIVAQMADGGAEARQEISVADAVERAKGMDGKDVVFQGEAIGEVLDRGDHSWINVGDSAVAIGVWIAREAKPPELALGSWKRTGDSVRVEGVFHRACPEHGGDLDIHASSMSIIAAGRARAHVVGIPRSLMAAACLAAAAVLFPAWRNRERSAKARRAAESRCKMVSRAKR